MKPSKGRIDRLRESHFPSPIGRPGEPNNLGNEDYVHYFRRDFGAGPLWSWNDSAASPPFSGYGSYFIEFERPSSSVPEPAAAELLAVGIIWLCSRRQRR